MARRKQKEQLFDPGPKGPDRWRLHPDKWVQQPNIVYHASDEPDMPRMDRGGNVDVGYGDSAGMHFGDKHTAVARGVLASRQFVHTVRMTGPLTPTMSDHDANYSDEAGRAVREGKTVPYVNDYEDPGAISYRALPETVRTWSRDVAADPTAHPALKHLAQRGYNPMLNAGQVHKEAYDTPRPLQLFEADLLSGGKAVAHFVNEDDAFAHAQGLAAAGKPAGVKRNNWRSIDYKKTASEAVPRLTRPE